MGVAMKNGKKSNHDGCDKQLWFYFTKDHCSQKDSGYCNANLDPGQRYAQQSHHGTQGHHHGKGYR